MKAAVLHGNEDIRYEEFPEPQVRPGTVKIRVKACGICGSDVPRVLEHGAHYYPIVLGHEFSGIVVQIGEDTETVLREGDHVAVAPLIPCMECEACKEGLYSLCRHYSFIGSREQGAYAEYIVVPARNAVKIDPSIPFEQGALFEPSTVALHGIEFARYVPGGTVAVVGGGTIGTFTVQWARILGAAKIVVFGRDKKHLELSGRLGADAMVSTLEEGYLEKAMALTDGKGFDWVFEAAGTQATMKLCLTLAANRGTVCYIGTPVGDITFTRTEWELINRKEMFLTGSWMSGNAPYPGDEWTRTAQCFADGRLTFDPEIFYAIYDLQDAEKAFALYKEKGKVKGRVLFRI